MNTTTKSIISLFVCFFILSITGCGVVPSNEFYNTAKTHKQAADKPSSANKEYYQLLSNQKFLIDDTSDDAQRLINKISNQKLNTDTLSQQLISQARVFLNNNQPQTAIQKLEQVDHIHELPDPVKAIYYANATEAYSRRGQVKNSMIAEIALNDLLKQPALTHDIWYRLHTLPLKTLQTMRSQLQLQSVISWLDLAILSKQLANQPKSLIDSIQNWQQQHPNHLANQLLPQNNRFDTTIRSTPPLHIALLLPLQGNFGKMGRAVRDGFMTAFYEDSKRLSDVPDIKVYDTNQNKDIVALYHQAVQEGAQFVIGPLTKPNVERLSKTHIEVPTLALNYLSNQQRTPQHFMQFGLSSQHAAEQAATQMWQQGIDRIIMITPANDWGKNIKKSFSKRWQTQGGTIVDSLDFTNREQLSKQIPLLLRIDQSNQRTQQLETILGKKVRSIPRRRQDFNGIFLAGTPEQAQQIQPLLKFYYAGNIPTFSIFSIYPGSYQSGDHWDFESIYFNDVPWLLVQDHTINILKQRVQLLWPAEYRLHGRLFALGIDSYLLSILLPRLIMLPDFPINGVTGQLYLTHDSQIYQQLLWAKFGKRGIPKLLI